MFKGSEYVARNTRWDDGKEIDGEGDVPKADGLGGILILIRQLRVISGGA